MPCSLVWVRLGNLGSAFKTPGDGVGWVSALRCVAITSRPCPWCSLRRERCAQSGIRPSWGARRCAGAFAGRGPLIFAFLLSGQGVRRCSPAPLRPARRARGAPSQPLPLQCFWGLSSRPPWGICRLIERMDRGVRERQGAPFLPGVTGPWPWYCWRRRRCWVSWGGGAHQRGQGPFAWGFILVSHPACAGLGAPPLAVARNPENLS